MVREPMVIAGSWKYEEIPFLVIMHISFLARTEPRAPDAVGIFAWMSKSVYLEYL